MTERVEAAFLMRAIDLLAPGGRVLAILPSSVVASDRGRSLRERLLEVGCVRVVHELPRFTFPDIEARVYLFVFERSAQRSTVLLLNHRLIRPDRLVVPEPELGPARRLDYGYHFASAWYQQLRTALPRGEWSPLHAFARVSRGRADSPAGVRRAVHTTDYADCFWETARIEKVAARSVPSEPLRPADLVMARVGRQALRAIGPLRRPLSVDGTDCVLRVSPISARARTRLLFTLRCILTMSEVEDLLVRGAGARYVVDQDLAELHIPFALPELFPRTFVRYQRAVRARDAVAMLLSEQYVQRHLRARILLQA